MDYQLITPVVATTLTFSLAIIAFIYRGHGRINVAFGILMLNEALASCTSIITATNSIAQFTFGLKFAFLFNSMIFFSTFYFVLVLTGYIDRLDAKIWNIKIKHMIYISIVLVIPVFTMLQFTDILLVGIEPRHDYGFDVEWSNYMFPVNLISFMMIAYTLTLLFKALKQSEPGIAKKFIRFNTVAVLILFSSGPIFGIFLPMIGVDSLPFIDSITVLSSLIFFITINKYSYELINELNYGLEQKVEERTRDLKETQSRLVQSEKMASLGRLVAGIAHEINNPIGSICSSNDTIIKASNKLEKTLREKLGSEYEEDRNIGNTIKVINNVSGVIKEGGTRVADIVQRMKRFTQLDEAELQESDIHQGIDDTIAVFQPQLQNNIQIKKNYGDLPKITCFPAKLNQLVLLLLENSNKAIKENGTISFTTRKNGNNIQIIMTDDGIGIPEENLPRIFDPGFTTWGVGVGVGLGLSICYKIVEEHKGQLEIDSEKDKGTTVTITIPVNLEAAVNGNNSEKTE